MRLDQIDQDVTRIRKRILGLLQEERYEINEDLLLRVDQFLDCIERRPQPVQIQSIFEWLGQKRRECGMVVDVIPMRDVAQWAIDPVTGFISHESKEFFEVIGIRVLHGDQREQQAWCQPIIYQREMGILGILCKTIKGKRCYLLQAKAEPGNLHKLQISPTLQATVSNLKRAHGGKKPLFAEYFENPNSGSVLYATYQTEDGGRLYLKSNLNMLVEVGENELNEIPADFRWFTMYEIKQLLKYENIINPHVRSIISPL